MVGFGSRAQILSTLALLLAIAPAANLVAGVSDTEPVEPTALQVAIEQLQKLVDTLTPHVEDLESREDPPTTEERQQAQPYVDQLTAAMREVERLIESTGADELPVALREARKLFRRMTALELVRRAAELRIVVDNLLARSAPPTDAEMAELRRLGMELQTTLVELTSEARSARPGQATILDAEEAVALTESFDALAESADRGLVLETAEDDSVLTIEEEIAAGRSATEDLRASIARFEQDAGIEKADAEPAGLRRARAILVRLLVIDVERTVSLLRPAVERLENRPELPSMEELQPLQPLVGVLRTDVDALEHDLADGAVEESPSTLLSAVDLIRRFANLDLAASLSKLTPFVEACEMQQEPLAPDQTEKLRKIPGKLRPKMRSARRTTRKQYALDEVIVDSPEVAAAAEMLRRLTKLVPDSPLAQEEPVDAPDTQPVARFFRFYGSLRLRALAAEGRSVDVDGQTSRVGVRFEGRLTKKVTGLARAEVGFNFFDTDALQRFGEGRGIDTETLFFERLAFIGARLGRNEVRFGKQWGAFYDIGVFSDQMPYFAGQGTAVFAARSDGGIAGTGRADQALQFSNVITDFKYTLQVQIRDETANNQPFADTFGASLSWSMNDKMQIGGAYNEVRDGVPDPGPDEPKEGDRALIIGYRYQTDPLYLGTTVSLFDNHDTDDQGVFFGGLGIEAYGSYALTGKLMVRAALSALLPDSDYEGEYRVLSFAPGLNYKLTTKLSLVFVGRLDFSKLSDGSDRDGDVISLALFFNF